MLSQNDMKELFLNDNSSFGEHLAAITSNPELYKVQLLLLLELVEIQKVTKTRSLLAALEHKQFELADVLLQHRSYGFPEVLAACKALDGKRRLRSWKASLKAFEGKGSSQVSSNKKPKQDKPAGNDETPKPEECLAKLTHDITKLVADREKEISDSKSRSAGKGKGKGAKGVAHRAARGTAMVRSIKGKGGKKGKGKGGKGQSLKRKREEEHDEPRWLRRRAAKIAGLKSDIGSLENALLEGLTATMSGSMCKRFQAWIKKIKKGTLMHYLLEFGLEPWKEFCDIIHINPNDLSLDEFLRCVYDSKRRRPGNVEYGLKLTNDTLEDITALKKHHVPLTYLRKKFDMKRVSNRVKAAITEYTDINTVVWWYEELMCKETDQILENRITKKCEVPSFGYGKLVERLMSMHAADSPVFQNLVPVAEEKIKEYHLPLKTPMAVLGDCSGSMHVAVRTGSIIVSLLTALGSADLLFFNHDAIDPLFTPKTIKDVLMLSHFTRADGATSPASALERLYLARKKVETLLLVSDEEENEPAAITKLGFTQLIKKYIAEINKDLKVVLVSFLPSKVYSGDLRPADQQLKGQMYLELVAEGIVPLQLRIDGNRPDLTKIDFLLGRLSSESKEYELGTELLLLMATWVPLASIAEIVSSFKTLGNEFVFHLIAASVRSFMGITPVAHPDKIDESHLRALTSVIEKAVQAKLVGNLDVGALEKCMQAKDVTTVQEMIGEWVPVYANSNGETTIDVQEERKLVVQKLLNDKTSAVDREDYVEAQRLKVQLQHLEKTPLEADVKSYYNTGFKISVEPLKRIFEFLPEKQLKRCCKNVSKTWRYLSLENIFDSIKLKKNEKWHDLLPSMEAFGLVDQFGTEKCIWALDRNRGNVERAIGSLFGEE
eukprot:TRINITY_DN4700_c0_g5_i1.p1 TRINITY_DN4700_c0_g5~~TRINITY_DN4700_c0_g5_i1.p1  ORF type:complete len:891 (+),score=307.70 TRINITY_DN4700_c0_g5_i1:64-2736(+)